MAYALITSWQIKGEKVETMTDFIWGGAPKSLWMVTAAMKLKDACYLGKKCYDKPRQHIKKKKRHHFASKGPCNQNYDFSSSHVQM